MKNQALFAQINVRVQPEVARKAKTLAKSRGLPLNRIVADAISLAFEAAQKDAK